MTLKRFALLFGIFTLLIALATWAIDLAHLTIQCIYCRSERTIMGILGIMLMLPIYPYLSRYLAYVLGFLGASIAAQQVMLVLQHSGIISFKFVLVIAVLFIIVGQVFLISLLEQNDR